MTNMTTPEMEAKNAPVFRAKRSNLATEFEQVQGVDADDLPASAKRGFDDPSLLNFIYHAFDGRAIPVPRGLTEFRIKETFPFEDFIPKKWQGKRVWYTDESAVEKPALKDLICPLSTRASDDVKADVEAMGYTSGICTKEHIGNMNAHIRAKHRVFQKEYTEYRTRKAQEEQAAAFLSLAGSLTERRGPGRPPKVPED